MKWIGQHIWSFISRFRSDVYLEDLGTSTETNILVVDSDGLVTKNTGAGDDMAFTLTGDSGSNQTIDDGSTLDIAGGNAISTVVGATDTVTVNHDDTSSQASVDNSGRTFVQDITLDTYGHVTGITSATDADTYTGDITGVTFTTDDAETISDTAGSADFIIAGGEGIDTTSAGEEITITGELASSSNKGVASFEADEFTVASGVVNLKNAVQRVYGATTIKLLPTDFLPNEDAGAGKTMTFDDTAPTGMKPGAAAMELVAIVDIPEGKKATHIDIYDNSHNLGIEAFEMNINASGLTSKGSGNANTQLDITDVNATATNYLAIVVTTTATSERVFGGAVTIADQ